MELIGNILKESTRIGAQRKPKTVKPANVQKRALLKLIKKSKNTSFGTSHNFAEIIRGENLIESFQANVPITNYERFHEQWLARTIAGEKNVIWPGKMNYFALSSGTTAGPSKKIPVSEKMIRKFQKATVQQLNGIHCLQLPASFYKSNVLIVGGSTHLQVSNKALNGDLSGILAKNKSLMFTPFTKPNARISKIKDWDEKVEAIIKKAPNWNIGVIAGVPSWVAQLLERIIERYNLSSIHDIWPNLKLYIHGGIFLKPYQSKFDSLFGKPMVYQNTYLASEGYFAYQRDFLKGGMQLLLSNGIFYEFIEEKYFHLIDSSDQVEIPTLTIDQVQERTPYAMVVSTCSGLWRYSIGDTIEFTNVPSRTIQITGRTSFYLSTHGEHLSDSNLITAIELLSQKMKTSIEEFTVYSSSENDRQYWYVGASGFFSEKEGAYELDRALRQINEDYASVRKHLLKPPRICVLPTVKFYEFLEKSGKAGGQNKFPHVLTEEKHASWLQHLAD